MKYFADYMNESIYAIDENSPDFDNGTPKSRIWEKRSD